MTQSVSRMLQDTSPNPVYNNESHFLIFSPGNLTHLTLMKFLNVMDTKNIF